jgi:hypothetical protein
MEESVIGIALVHSGSTVVFETNMRETQNANVHQDVLDRGLKYQRESIQQ